MVGSIKGRYTAWIASEKDLKDTLRAYGSSTVFSTEEITRRICGAVRPLRVTIVVRGPKLSPEKLRKARQERILKLNASKRAKRASRGSGSIAGS